MQTAVDVTKTRVIFVEGRIMRTDACREKYEPIHKGNVDYYFSNFIPSCMAEWKLVCAHNVVWNGVLACTLYAIQGTRLFSSTPAAAATVSKVQEGMKRKVHFKEYFRNNLRTKSAGPLHKRTTPAAAAAVQMLCKCYADAMPANAMQACTSSNIKMTFASLLPLQMTAY